jgi:hypothetical protein
VLGVVKLESCLGAAGFDTSYIQNSSLPPMAR